MEHVAAFMLLVGCNGDLSVCQEIPVSVPAYESVAECTQDLNMQIRISGASDNKVFGTCKAVDEDMFQRASTIDWAISKSGQLLVSFDAAPQVVASR
ncbi:hypothetical protein [Mangrovibrevibacter kandeliae]|uniref:hypothetical protein n=1 Tax=Mangrovibrevibacter kandeliae TaxID=2968473 RepID=UPI002118EC66|nr:hypothetical protein [Aurantimonas sp. CSK15Z-1]MCQ8780959.1 hypothetical protein [Aurantimonas sp. CSK15Z-1]